MKSSKTSFRRSRLVPVAIAGKQVMIDANSIGKGDQTTHHGETAAGAKVNSARSYGIGDSTIVWPADGAPPVSFKNDDLEVLATQFLANRGLVVTPAVQQA